MTDEESIERAVLLQKLEPDQTDEYLDAHEDVPEPVIDRMEKSGVHEFRLFVEDQYSVGYIEADDLDRFREEYNADPDCQAWEERLADCKQSGVDTESGEFPVMEEVWAFES